MSVCEETETEVKAEEISLSSFFNDYGDILNKMIQDVMAPVYDKENFGDWETKNYRKIHKLIKDSSFKELDNQVHAILGLSKGFYQKHLRSLFMVGEMGTGKTFIGAMVSYLMPKTDKRIVVMCPSHLVIKWQREFLRVMPDAAVKILKKISDVSTGKPKGTEIWILSKETAKLHYSKAFFSKKPKNNFSNWLEDVHKNDSLQHMPFPKTWGRATLELLDLANSIKIPYKIKRVKATIEDGKITITSPEKETLTLRSFGKKTFRSDLAYARIKKNIHSYSDFLDENASYRKRCAICGRDLEEAFIDDKYPDICKGCYSKQSTFDRSGIRRYAIAEYIKRKKPQIDLCIMDEVHELKGGTSAQGQAMSNICGVSDYRLCMTGTLMGGYSSNLYHLLFRLFTKDFIKQGYEHDSAVAFSEKYGVTEIKEIFDESSRNDISRADHAYSIGRKVAESRKEKPGISPALIPDFLLGYSYFLKLDELSADMPPYEEHLHLIPMCAEQRRVYDDFKCQIMSKIGPLMTYETRMKLASAVNMLWSLPDRVRHNNCAKDMAYSEAIELDTLPKEEKLLAIIKEAKAKNRKVWVFAENTDRRDILKETAEFLNKRGIKTEILRSYTTPPKNRENWIQKRLEQNDADAFLSNPSLVKTGLDLYEFQDLVFYQTGYNIYTLRQASRRSWRLGQKESINAHFLCYADSAQSDAMKLIANKLVTSLAVEGDLSESGLSDMATSANSVLHDLTRNLVNGTEEKGVTEAFATYRKKDIVKNHDIKEVVNPLEAIRKEMDAEAERLSKAYVPKVNCSSDDPANRLLEKGIEPVSVVMKSRKSKKEETVTFFSIDQLLSA